MSGKDDGYQLRELKYIRGNLSKTERDPFAKENRGMRFTALGTDNDQNKKFNCAEHQRKGFVIRTLYNNNRRVYNMEFPSFADKS